MSRAGQSEAKETARGRASMEYGCSSIHWLMVCDGMKGTVPLDIPHTAASSELFQDLLASRDKRKGWQVHGEPAALVRSSGPASRERGQGDLEEVKGGVVKI